MNCPICEQEFYGMGFNTHNEKTLCRSCLKWIMDTHHYKFVGQYVEIKANA